MNKITEMLLKILTGFKDEFAGAYNIRENGLCAARQSSPNIRITVKTDEPGLDIRIDSRARGETVYIPACVTQGGVDDLVYNDFYVDAGADVIIVAGCGVHTDGAEDAAHDGIHRFFLENGSRVIYREKHVGTGTGSGLKRIDPVTFAVLGPGSALEMDTVQLGGVDRTVRKTSARLAAAARLTIRERIQTDGRDTARTDFTVSMDGDGSAVNLISRSVARGSSRQTYRSRLMGNCRCSGHSECDAILMDRGRVDAFPELIAGCRDASLIHEAAIGRIAGEQIVKLRTLGLSEEEAERRIIEGFLGGVAPM